MATTREERVLEIREKYKGKNMDIIPSPKTMQTLYEILLPEAIEIIKKRKQQNSENIL